MTSENKPTQPPGEPKRFVFLDLETTGFDPSEDRILEVGVIVTDETLKELGRFERVLALNPLEPLEPVVLEMHAKSGLLPLVYSEFKNWSNESCLPSFSSRIHVQQELLEFLAKHDCKKAPLAGNSVGDFDRHFLRNHFPDVNDFLSHRSLNVSTFAVLADAWGIQKPEAKGAHRAIADAESSIEQFRFYMEKLGEFFSKYITTCPLTPNKPR